MTTAPNEYAMPNKSLVGHLRITKLLASWDVRRQCGNSGDEYSIAELRLATDRKPSAISPWPVRIG